MPWKVLSLHRRRFQACLRTAGTEDRKATRVCFSPGTRMSTAIPDTMNVTVFLKSLIQNQDGEEGCWTNLDIERVWAEPLGTTCRPCDTTSHAISLSRVRASCQVGSAECYARICFQLHLDTALEIGHAEGAKGSKWMEKKYLFTQHRYKRLAKAFGVPQIHPSVHRHKGWSSLPFPPSLPSHPEKRWRHWGGSGDGMAWAEDKA